MRVGGFNLGAVTAPEGVEGAFLVDPPVGVRAEEVAQPLGHRGVGALRADDVVVRQRRTEARDRHAGLGGLRDDAAPRRVGVGQALADRRGLEQGLQVAGRVLVGDAVEQLGADDAAGAPDAGAGGHVDVPAVLDAGDLDQVQALGVGDDLRGKIGSLLLMDLRQFRN